MVDPNKMRITSGGISSEKSPTKKTEQSPEQKAKNAVEHDITLWFIDLEKALILK